MVEGLTISNEEAREILDTMDNLEGEFAGCIPSQGECRVYFDPLSVECRLCKRLREFLDREGKEE